MKPSSTSAGIAKGGLGERLDLPRDPWFLARVDSVSTDGPQNLYDLVEVTPILSDYGSEDKAGGIEVSDAVEINNAAIVEGVIVIARFRAWADAGPTYEFQTGSGGTAAVGKRVEVVRATADGPIVSCYIQDDNGSGALIDTADSITVKIFPSPAREDFETDGIYIAVKVGMHWWAETGPKTECLTVISSECVDGGLISTSVTFRAIDRACA